MSGKSELKIKVHLFLLWMRDLKISELEVMFPQRVRWGIKKFELYLVGKKEIRKGFLREKGLRGMSLEIQTSTSTINSEVISGKVSGNSKGVKGNPEFRMDETKVVRGRGRPWTWPFSRTPRSAASGPSTVEEWQGSNTHCLIKILLKFYFKMSVFNDISRT